MSDDDTDPALSEERRRRVADALEDSSAEVDDVDWHLPDLRRLRKQPSSLQRRVTRRPDVE
jgi:hypothetical protein